MAFAENLAVVVSLDPPVDVERGARNSADSEQQPAPIPTGVAYLTRGRPLRFIALGQAILRADSEIIGLAEGSLSERHVAFLALMILDRDGMLGRPGSNRGGPSEQRHRFAEILGMNRRSFRRWLARSL